MLGRNILPLCLALFASTSLAKTVTYDFNVTWTKGNPDGRFERDVIGINNKWPLPTIDVNKGDRLIVKVHNGLGNQPTSLHFHGLFQNNTNYMDGPVQVTQCGIMPGESFTYDFVVEQPGTYWYHSHQKFQYPDGIRAPFIVRDPEGPYAKKYDEEIIVSFSDWYHEQIPNLMKHFVSIANPTGAEPVPDSPLINDSQNVSLKVEPGKTYMVRMVNMGAFAAQYVWFEGHTMRIVEVDGVYVDEAEAEMIYLTAAQRVSALITMRNDTDANFPFMGSMDQDLFDTVPPGLNPNVTGWLVYDDKKEKPDAKLLDAFEPFDDATLVPEDKEALYEDPVYSFKLDVMMENLNDGANYAFFNNVTYVPPKVPTLYTVMSAGDKATNPFIYGRDTNTHVFPYNGVIEIVLNNLDTGKHPFHLHGHNFQVAYRSEDDAGVYTNNVTMNKTPMRRDTVLVHPRGYVILRFRSDNPGVWLFHCHIEWHLASGLMATFVEAPLQMQKNIKIPQAHLDACAKAKVVTKGNAAGNDEDWFNLAGQNLAPGRLPAGFTARGIVALVFSCIAAFLGMAVVAFYGAQGIKKDKEL